MVPRTEGDREPPPVICWGEVLWDEFPDARRLGGAPANVAVHLAALGVSVMLVSRVGDDEPGREIVATLAARGVDTAHVQIDPRRPTGRVAIELEAGEPSYRLTPGCAWEAIAADDAVCATIARASAMCFGTLSQIRGRADLERAVAALPPDRPVVCDVNLRPRFVEDDDVRFALRASSAVKLNEDEARIIGERLRPAGAGRERPGDAINTLGWLHDHFDVALCALTRGPAGCALYARGRAGDGWTDDAEHPGFAVDPGGDNVGAGDAFTAVLIAALLRGAALADTARAANRYAAFVASRPGATPEVPDHVLTEVTAMIAR